MFNLLNLNLKFNFQKNLLSYMNEKNKNIFFFEQNANSKIFIKLQKRYIFNIIFDYIEFHFFENQKNEILVFDEKLFHLEKNFLDIKNLLNINTSNPLTNEFIKFISNTSILLSSDDAADLYLYNELVVKYGNIPWKNLIKKYNLSEDFFSNQILLEKKINWSFWSKIQYKNEWIYDVDDLYVSKPLIPFYANANLIELIDSSMYPFNPIDWYLGWEIGSYYHYELFFFLWDIKQQPMFNYWTIIFLWYWTIFFEDNIIWDPMTVVRADKNHIFPDYFIYSSSWDMIYSYEWAWDHINFLYDSLLLEHISFQDDSFDKLNFVFDKNFVYLWHYIWGGDHDFNFMYEYNMINWFQKLKSQILNPLVNYPSLHTNLKTPYFTHFEWAFYMSFFPDTLIPKGWINMFLDYWTADYNRFFHAGFTLMDGLSLLEIFWYQAAVVVWGEFDSFTEDYMAYQSIYFLDSAGALRTALIALILKNAENKRYYELFIQNYNFVFNFTANRKYKKYLKADILYPLSLEQRLSLFNDDILPHYRIHQSERLANMFFGYNVSLFVNNHAYWYSVIWHSTELYWQLGFDSIREEDREDHHDWLLLEYSSLYFTHNFKIQQYAQFSPFDEITNYFSTKNIYTKYFNEKFTDEIGFFFTSIMRGENPTLWTPILQFNNFLLKYSSDISFFNDSWLRLHSFYKSFDLHLIFWYIGLRRPFYEWIDVAWREIKFWFFETFELSWRGTFVREVFFRHKNVFNYSSSCPWHIVLYFSIWLDKIFGLFFDINYILSSRVFFLIHWFTFNRKSTFELISTENFFSSCMYLIKKFDNKFCLIKIFNEPIQLYIMFLNKIFTSKIFQYFFSYIFKNFFVTDRLFIGISKLSVDDYKFNCATVNFCYQGLWPFPLEFYLPFLYWKVNDFSIIESHPVYFPFEIKIYDYFQNENLSFSEYLEKLVLLMLVYQVTVDDYKMDSKFLHNLLCLLNELEYDDTGFLDFSRYLNFVVKKNLYYENFSSFKENYTLQTNNIKSNLVDKLIENELELYKKTDLVVDLSVKNIHNLNEEFFHMCTDDLKKVLNYWISWNLKNSYNDA